MTKRFRQFSHKLWGVESPVGKVVPYSMFFNGLPLAAVRQAPFYGLQLLYWTRVGIQHCGGYAQNAYRGPGPGAAGSISTFAIVVVIFSRPLTNGQKGDVWEQMRTGECA